MKRTPLSFRGDISLSFFGVFIVTEMFELKSFLIIVLFTDLDPSRIELVRIKYKDYLS